MGFSEPTSVPRLSSSSSQEPDPAEAARLQQLQLQSQSKLNRKQRRKLQQMQQQQVDQTQQPKTEVKQTVGQSENPSHSLDYKAVVSEQLNRDGTKTDHLNTPKSKESQQTSGAVESDPTQLQQSSQTAMTNPPTQLPPNPTKGSPGPVQALIPGMASALRPGISHPLLQQQLMQQQLHLQMRMAQGGLLQPPFSPHQFALLNQIAQLQMVQQRLAAQTVHLGQKHAQPGMPTQQQLYQQQQQIALMIAQMQQQVLQQPNLAGRFPGDQQQQPQKGVAKQNAGDKGVGEGQQGKTSEVSTSQPADVAAVPVNAAEERSKQASPVPQSRLQQWKQPLIQDHPPASSSTTATTAVVDSVAQTTSGPKPDSSSVPPSAFTAPATVSTNVNTQAESQPIGSGLSPRNRISDPVSNRWGVDAGPKLSADPPEFKPGVPWRPTPRKESKEDDVPKDGATPTAANISQPGASPALGLDTWGKPTPQVQNAPSTSSGSPTGKSNPGFSEATFPSNPTSTQPQFGLGLPSAWQTPDDKAAVGGMQNSSKPVASPGSVMRPPPGLSSENTFPESPLFGEEPPRWLKNLIGGQSIGSGSNQTDMQFSRFDFANSGNAWSNQDGSQQFNPSVQPWAAPVAPSLADSSSTAIPTTTAVAVASGAQNTSELPKRPNLGITSWSANQPIPSAQEKVAVSSVTPDAAEERRKHVAVSSSGQRSSNNPMSTWLVLRNLTPRVR